MHLWLHSFVVHFEINTQINIRQDEPLHEIMHLCLFLKLFEPSWLDIWIPSVQDCCLWFRYRIFNNSLSNRLAALLPRDVQIQVKDTPNLSVVVVYLIYIKGIPSFRLWINHFTIQRVTIKLKWHWCLLHGTWMTDLATKLHWAIISPVSLLTKALFK